MWVPPAPVHLQGNTERCRQVPRRFVQDEERGVLAETAGDHHQRGAAQDITDRKQVEHEARKQLSEREALLGEVHHRVKNNIATIASPFSLQIGHSVSSEVTAALQDTLSRVQSIRVLYENLLISDELDEISMNDYVERLLDAIVMDFDPRRAISRATTVPS